MFVYELLFLVGAIGFAAMSFLAGLQTGGHHGGSHSHAGADSGGHALHSHSSPGDHQAVIASSLRGGTAKGGRVHSGAARSARWKSILFLSPLDIFAMCLAAGATGLLGREHVPPAFLPWLSFLAGVLLDYGIVRPFLGYFFRLADRPSEVLEETVARSAQAISRFDSQGRGLVTLTLDGQNVQLLAQLDPSEREQGVQVQRGDEVVILEVDAHRNSCRVTRQLSS